MFLATKIRAHIGIDDFSLFNRLKHAYYLNISKRPSFFGSKGNFHVASSISLLGWLIVIFILNKKILSLYFGCYLCFLWFSQIYCLVYTKLNKKSNVGIESRFETQNICFDPEKLVFWNRSNNKHALKVSKISRIYIIFHQTYHPKGMADL